MLNETFLPVALTQDAQNEPLQFTCARKLHAWLGVKRDFSNWIKTRIDQCQFQFQTDYVTSETHKSLIYQFSPDLANTLTASKTGFRPLIEYFVTIDVAKELAMLEKTPKGHEARRYFIQCEKQLVLHQKMLLQQQTNQLVQQLQIEANARCHAENSVALLIVSLKEKTNDFDSLKAHDHLVTNSANINLHAAKAYKAEYIKVLNECHRQKDKVKRLELSQKTKKSTIQKTKLGPDSIEDELDELISLCRNEGLIH